MGHRLKERSETMKSGKILNAVLLAGLAVTVGMQAQAIPLGQNITVFDGNIGGVHPWHNTMAEDNEGEPGVFTVNQTWDLEGIFLDNLRLTVVAGYSFQNYQNYHVGPGTLVEDRAPGDIFIDVTGDAGDPTAPALGYEYVLDLDFANLTFSAYALNGSSQFLYPRMVNQSAPWRYLSGGQLLPGWWNVPMAFYQDGMAGTEVAGMQGTVCSPDTPEYYSHHSAFSLDLGGIPYDTPVTFHYTIGCGNDMLRGVVLRKIPDGGTTVLMLGLALAGIGLILCRRHA